MTVSEMDTYVSRLLNDVNSTKWTQAAFRLPALNAAQKEFMLKLMGYGFDNPNVLGAVSELVADQEVSVASSGYTVSSLTLRYMHNGFVGAKCILNEVELWATRVPVSDLNQQNNRYAHVKGSDSNPVVYFLGGTLYVLAGLGSYPVTTTLYYVREPKELVASGASGYQVTTCELNTMYHELICRMAAADCHRQVSDEVNYRKFIDLKKETDAFIEHIARGAKAEDVPNKAEVVKNA